MEVVAVEEHAGADQKENAPVERRKRKPVEACSGVDRARHDVSPGNVHKHTSRQLIVASCTQADGPFGSATAAPGPRYHRGARSAASPKRPGLGYGARLA